MHGYYTGDRCGICFEDAYEARLAGNDDYRKRLALAGYSFRPTTDYWYPCFDRGLVGIHITEPVSKKMAEAMAKHSDKYQVGSCVVSVSGGDDDFYVYWASCYEEAVAVVKGLPSIISKDDLRVRGFKFQG
jgi:hypothetical protein